MADCDDYPGLYFPDGDGDFAWERSDGGKDLEQKHFNTFEEAKLWAQKNVGKAITRSPDGVGFIIKK